MSIDSKYKNTLGRRTEIPNIWNWFTNLVKMNSEESTPLINNRGDGNSSFDPSNASRYGPSTTDIRGKVMTHNKEQLIE